MKYQIPEPGTTISGFADNKKKKLKKIMQTDRPQIFLTCDRKHTYFFVWPQTVAQLGTEILNISFGKSIARPEAFLLGY